MDGRYFSTEELAEAKLKELRGERMRVFRWDDYYDTERCPHCGRLRIMIAHTEYGTKRVCEKCEWCVEDNNYFVKDETVEEER